jgi:hypothetical protein
MRHPARWVASLALLAAIVAVALALAAGHTHGGVPPDVKAPRGLQTVSLAQNAAYSYNPFGTGPEDASQASNVLDGDPNTTWSTEHYIEGKLEDKPGVGIYLDAAPGVQARAVVIQTPTPGFSAGVYASNGFDENLAYGNTTPLIQRGWTPLATPRPIEGSTTIRLNDPTNAAYRYYLVWIVTLPPGSDNAEISGVALLK